MHPCTDVEESLETINVEEITAEAIRAYLDLPDGGIKEVEMLTHEQILRRVLHQIQDVQDPGGQSELLREFSVLFMMGALLHQNPYAMPRGKGSLFIAEFEGHRID